MKHFEDILIFWFGEIDKNGQVEPSKTQAWWKKDVNFDDLVKDNFEEDVKNAHNGLYDHWKMSARGRLALIILLDQFPRNIYRDSPQSYAFDQMALLLAEQGIELKQDQELLPIERVFFYMPLEHSEDITTQHHCVALFEKLVIDATEADKSTYENFLEYAEKHRDIIAQFDRFPHRNAILGRESTEEELEFLKQPGSSF